MKTDISGWTLRLRALGERQFATLLTEHRDLLSRVATAHDGRIVKPEGDGYWLVFPSVTAAALAAMSMQEELRLAQSTVGDTRLSMRIVTALGDIVHADGGLVGEAVVLTTRVEAIAPPDEIYVAASAWLSMNHAKIRSTFVDSFSLKGFTEPVLVYRLEQTHRLGLSPIRTS